MNPLYIFSDPSVQLNGLKSVRRMVASWAGQFNAAVRGQEFLWTDQIILFGLRALHRLDNDYNEADDYMAQLASVSPVPDTNYFLFLEYGRPKTPKLPIPRGEIYFRQI